MEYGLSSEVTYLVEQQQRFACLCLLRPSLTCRLDEERKSDYRQAAAGCAQCHPSVKVLGE